MLKGFDHIIAMVHDIDAASADLSAAGFEVVRRPDAALTETDNRFISFPDGSYFQICTFFDAAKSADHKWAKLYADGAGWVDYSLWTDDAAGQHARLAAAGFAVPEPRVSTKPLTDGLTWSAAILHAGRGIGASPLRPYFVEDRGPRGIRVPPPTRSQPGNALGILGVTLLAADLGAALAGLTAIYGEGTAIASRFGGAARIFPVGDAWLEVAEAKDGSTASTAHLATRGDGVFEVAIGTAAAKPGEGTLLPLARTHGARIRVAA